MTKTEQIELEGRLNKLLVRITELRSKGINHGIRFKKGKDKDKKLEGDYAKCKKIIDKLEILLAKIDDSDKEDGLKALIQELETLYQELEPFIKDQDDK